MYTDRNASRCADRLNEYNVFVRFALFSCCSQCFSQLPRSVLIPYMLTRGVSRLVTHETVVGVGVGV